MQDGSCLLLPAERSMLHRALAVTVFLLFPGGSPKNSLQRVGQSVLLDSIRLLRAQPVVLGWADCKAIWLLSLPALSPYLCSLGQSAAMMAQRIRCPPLHAGPVVYIALIADVPYWACSTKNSELRAGQARADIRENLVPAMSIVQYFCISLLL